jgi:SAM-dependent methyltransferase
MTLPENNSEYAEKEYWATRYEKEKHYDWFKAPSYFIPLITPKISTTSKILNLGCGNSALGAELYDSGYPHITNIDYIDTVITEMTAQNTSRPEMLWLVGDCLNMKLASASFDVCLDKGTLDAFLAGSTSAWTLPDDVLKKVEQYMKEVWRVLRPGGCFIYITL